MSYITRLQSLIQNKLAPRTTGTTVGAGGIAISSSCGNFSTTSTVFVNVTNLSVTITTTGRPVKVMVVPDGVNNSTGSNFSSGGVMRVQIINNTTSAQIGACSAFSGIGTPANLICLDTSVNGTPGTYTYIVQTNVNSGTGFVQYAKLVAYEI